ncbi:hypothetical protein F4775DRAFT_329142 [Biscogniauxia sp. FL1348]|nr:hypothetical protein F4775DRAFT_329142 [Biscogniauxia sp. FL1348]
MVRSNIARALSYVHDTRTCLTLPTYKHTCIYTTYLGYLMVVVVIMAMAMVVLIACLMCVFILFYFNSSLKLGVHTPGFFLPPQPPLPYFPFPASLFLLFFSFVIPFFLGGPVYSPVCMHTYLHFDT